MTRYAVVRAGRVEVVSEDVEAIARAIVPGESMEVVPGDVAVGDRWPRPLPVGRPREGRPRLVRYPEAIDDRMIARAAAHGWPIAEEYRRAVAAWLGR